jgi:hypothetical protein
VDNSTARGIYTGHGGSVTVEAAGTIDVNGSRIATYDGGDLNVYSGTPVSAKDGQPVSWADVVTGPGIVPYVADPAGGLVYNQTKLDAGGNLVFDTVKGKVVTGADGQPVHGYLVNVTGGGINAGTGAEGFFSVNGYAPVQYRLDSHGNIIPGSLTVAQPPTDQFFGSGLITFTGVGSAAHVGNVNLVAGGDILAGTGGILQVAFNSVDQTAATLNLYSSAGSIHAGNSGVLGRNVSAEAGKGSVDGIFVASGNATISAANNVSVTALAGGTASVSGGGTVSGTVVGSSVSVAGSEVQATSISTGGGGGGSSSAFASTPAPEAQKATDDSSKTVASAQDNGSADDEEKKKRGKAPVLAQKVSRVTVILPKKS